MENASQRKNSVFEEIIDKIVINFQINLYYNILYFPKFYHDIDNTMRKVVFFEGEITQKHNLTMRKEGKILSKRKFLN